jgi:hypothetical protein
VADSEGRKITDEDQAELRRASAEEDDALNDLIHTSPETRSGAGAFLSYLVSISDELAPKQASCAFSELLRSPVLALGGTTITSENSADGGDKRRAFDGAASEWLAARAALETPGGERTDPETDRLQARLDAAEVALVATPAAYPDAVWLKFELIENLVTGDRVAGNSVYPLTILALASLKADIISIGLRRPDYGRG